MFVKGQSGNPAGKPKGTTDYVAKLHYALQYFETVNGKSFIQFAVEKATQDNAVLVALLKKILPDMNESKISGYLESSGDKERLLVVKERLREFLVEFKAKQKTEFEQKLQESAKSVNVDTNDRPEGQTV